MPGVLTVEEYAKIRRLKQEEIFLHLGSPEAQAKLVRNVEVAAFACSDDHTDMLRHIKIVLGVDVVHAVRVFGGPLALVPGYGDYNQAASAWLMANIEKGMKRKKVEHLLKLSHGPCGMGDLYAHPLETQIGWMIDSREIMTAFSPFFKRIRIYSLYHVKRINKAGNIEQNNYLADFNKLKKFIEKGGLK